MCVIACSILSLTSLLDWMLFYTKASNLLNGALGLISSETAWCAFSLGTIARNKFPPVDLPPACFLLERRITMLRPLTMSFLILLRDRRPVVNGLGLTPSRFCTKYVIFNSSQAAGFPPPPQAPKWPIALMSLSFDCLWSLYIAWRCSRSNFWINTLLSVGNSWRKNIKKNVVVTGS